MGEGRASGVPWGEGLGKGDWGRLEGSDGFHFGISPFSSGVLAWSRILHDQELLIVANTHTQLTPMLSSAVRFLMPYVAQGGA